MTHTYTVIRLQSSNVILKLFAVHEIDLKDSAFFCNTQEWIREADFQETAELRRFLVREMSRQSLNSMTNSLTTCNDSPLLTRIPFQSNTQTWLGHIPESDEGCRTLRDIHVINTEVENEGTESMEDVPGNEPMQFEVEAQIEAALSGDYGDVPPVRV